MGNRMRFFCESFRFLRLLRNTSRMPMIVHLLLGIAAAFTTTPALAALEGIPECGKTNWPRCLTWNIRGMALSPDNRYLFVSYAYAVGGAGATPWVLARLDLQNGLAAKRLCLSPYGGVALPKVSPSGKFLITRAWDTGGTGLFGIGLFDVATGKGRWMMSPVRGDLAWMLFGKTDHELFLVTQQEYGLHAIYSHDLPTKRSKLVFPKIAAEFCSNGRCDLTRAENNLGFINAPSFDPVHKALVIVGATPRREEMLNDFAARLPDTLPKPDRERAVQFFNFMFSLDVGSGELSLHPLSNTIDFEKKNPLDIRDFQNVSVSRDGTIYFVQQKKSRTDRYFLFTGKDGSARPVVELTPNEGERIEEIGPLETFTMSADASLVAFAFYSFGEIERIRSVKHRVAVVSTVTGQRWNIDLGSQAFRDLSSEGC